MEEPCRFWAQGSCAFGSVCRFSHTGPQRKVAAKKVAAAPVREEHKVDPYDEEVCTYSRLEAKYAGQYDDQELKSYWRYDMRPLVGDQLAAFQEKQDRGKREVCRFFLKGGCQFGEACRNLHVVDVADLDQEDNRQKPAQKPSPADDQEVSGPAALLPGAALPDFVPGRVGPAVRGRGLIGPAIGPSPIGPPLDPSNMDMALPVGPWPARGRPGPSPAGHGPVGQGRHLAEASQVDDAECVICTESIRKRGERFGMLENCDHAFCLSCIRSWRKQREQQDRVNLRMCPLCRNESFFVIPCDRLILDPKEKADAIEDYKRDMSLIPCKAFDYGRGKCSLGASCFYAHLNPDGTRFIPQAPRKMAGKDGTQLVGEVKLCDFLS